MKRITQKQLYDLLMEHGALELERPCPCGCGDRYMKKYRLLTPVSCDYREAGELEFSPSCFMPRESTRISARDIIRAMYAHDGGSFISKIRIPGKILWSAK